MLFIYFKDICFVICGVRFLDNIVLVNKMIFGFFFLIVCDNIFVKVL